MALDSIPPKIDNMLRGHDRRLKELERRLTGAQIPPVPPSQSTPPFSFPGAAVDGSTTPLWFASLPKTYIAVRISARGVGPSSASADIHVNGATVQTVVLNAGDTTDVYSAAFSMVENDNMDVLLVNAGGCTDISVQPIEDAT